MEITPYLIAYVFLLITSSTACFLLAVRILGIRKAQGAYSLLLVLVSSIIWSTSNVMEIATTGIAAKLFWVKMEYLGIAFLAPGMFFFAMYYSGRGRWLTKTRIMSFLGLAGAGFIAAATNEIHGGLWTDIELTKDLPFGPLTFTHGSVFYFFVAYQYTFILVTTLIFLQITLREHKIIRTHARAMLTCMVFPWLANIIYVTNWNLIPQLDITPLALTFSSAALSFIFLRYQRLDLHPIAHDSVFNAMQDGVIVLDRNERIVDANPVASLIFQDKGDFIGRDITSLFPKWHEWHMPFSKGEIKHEFKLDLSGEKLTFNLRTTSIVASDGRRNGRVLLISDITTQKQAEEEMMATSRMKSQLIANLGHDLRSPLGAIIGYAEMLKDGSFGVMSDNQEKASSEILDAANQLLSFINNIVGQAQIDTGKINLREYPFDVEEVIGPLLSTLNYHATKKGIVLNQFIDPNLPNKLIGDQFWLRQIVMNLVHNAVKFTNEGFVSVRFLNHHEGFWAIQVSDTGIGIPLEAQKSVFDAFQQVNSLENSNQHGFGLGLSIVAKLTSLMNGKIELQSKADHGSTFTIILPLKKNLAQQT